MNTSRAQCKEHSSTSRPRVVGVLFASISKFAPASLSTSATVLADGLTSTHYSWILAPKFDMQQNDRVLEGAEAVHRSLQHTGAGQVSACGPGLPAQAAAIHTQQLPGRVRDADHPVNQSAAA